MVEEEVFEGREILAFECMHCGQDFINKTGECPECGTLMSYEAMLEFMNGARVS